MVRKPSTGKTTRKATRKTGPRGGGLLRRLKEVAEKKTLTAKDLKTIRDLRGDLGKLDDAKLGEILADLRGKVPTGKDDIGIDVGGIDLSPGDFTGSILKPGQIAGPINDLIKSPKLPVLNALDFVTDTLFDHLREKQPEAIPLKPLKPGNSGAAIPVTSLALTRLVRLAAVRMSGNQEAVVWDDGRSEILVRPALMKAVVNEGQIRIDIPTESDAGRASMRVVFGMGGGDRSAGLVVSTLDRPAGNATVARVWGDALIALAYGALMDAAGSLIGASGRDIKNQRLVPRAFRAEKGRLTIESQARLDFKEAKR